MDILKVMILSVIEGLTEFLPVSSTGHLVLAEKVLTLRSTEFANAFGVIIQLGAIMSVVYLYFGDLNPISADKLLRKVSAQDYEQMKFSDKLQHRDLATMRIWAKIIVGFFPAAVLGFLFDDFIDHYLFNEVTVAIALIFYGVVIILMESWQENKTFRYEDMDEVSLKTAFLIGCFQCLAMVPGTSRSAATIIGAMILGCSRTTAAKFSFYLAIPTMLGATGLKILKMGTAFSLYEWFLILLGGVLSYFVAIVVIRKFLGYIRNHNFKGFGVYRIVLGAVVLVITFIM